MTDASQEDHTSKIEEEIKAYHEEDKPKRDNKVLVFIGAFIIIFGLLAAFLITTNQNVGTGEETSLSGMDQGLAAKLEPLQERLSANPKDAGTMIEIGFLYHEAGAYRESIRNFEKAKETDPTSVDALVGLGMSYQAVGRREEAAPEFDRAIEIEPDNSFAQIRKAYFLADSDKTSEALELLRAVDTAEADADVKASVADAIAELEKKFAD